MSKYICLLLQQKPTYIVSCNKRKEERKERKYLQGKIGDRSIDPCGRSIDSGKCGKNNKARSIDPQARSIDQAGEACNFPCIGIQSNVAQIAVTLSL